MLSLTTSFACLVTFYMNGCGAILHGIIIILYREAAITTGTQGLIANCNDFAVVTRFIMYRFASISTRSSKGQGVLVTEKEL